jgi:hypothetical protein
VIRAHRNQQRFARRSNSPSGSHLFKGGGKAYLARRKRLGIRCVISFYIGHGVNPEYLGVSRRIPCDSCCRSPSGKGFTTSDHPVTLDNIGSHRSREHARAELVNIINPREV